jgi:hypothetical protein
MTLNVERLRLLLNILESRQNLGHNMVMDKGHISRLCGHTATSLEPPELMLICPHPNGCKSQSGREPCARPCLPFRDNARHLRDILESIDHIEAFLSNMDFTAYQTDLKTRSAVERQMQVITEASKRLGMMLRRCARGQTGRVFAAWAISYDTATIKLMMKPYGIRSRMSCRQCAR